MVNMCIIISIRAFSFVNLLDKKETTIGNLVDIHFICLATFCSIKTLAILCSKYNILITLKDFFEYSVVPSFACYIQPKQKTNCISTY
jgi:hypothetical protein